MNYTIIEPGFEYFDRHKDGYLKFLEKCTRTCYKSEEHIKEGSAEKLLEKVVNKYKHLSVTEHESCILRIDDEMAGRWVDRMIRMVPLFAHRFTWVDRDTVIISGNVRMWRELIDTSYILSDLIWGKIETVLSQKWPFFFSPAFSAPPYIEILDDNPVTNKDKLDDIQMQKHMTLTYKLIGDRSMSHQLVRHRMAAYSQESQRYCNYGKKGFQIIKPPSIIGFEKDGYWLDAALSAYEAYLKLLELGLPPEDARSVLPGCTKTEVVTTMTLGTWLHVFHHRADNPKAQWQIRGIMQGIREHAYVILPWMKDCVYMQPRINYQPMREK
jgi:thymidylate synthase ThyX